MKMQRDYTSALVMGILVVFIPVVTAQPGPDTMWTRVYQNITEVRTAYDVDLTTEGGYILAGLGVSGRNYLIKINELGDIQWSQYYGGGTFYSLKRRAVCTTSDGGYFLGGSVGCSGPPYPTYGRYAVKTNYLGDTLWTYFECPPVENVTQGVYDVSQTVDGGYISLRVTLYENISTGVDKFDDQGQLQWLSGSHLLGDAVGYSIQQTIDGGYIIAGYNQHGSPSQAFLVRMNDSGDTSWVKLYGGEFAEYVYSVRQIADGGFIFAGTTESFGMGGKDIYLVKTDNEGDTLWTSTYGGNSDDVAYDVRETPDGGYVFAGYTESFLPGRKVYLVRTDQNGTVLWTKTYGNSDYNEAFSIEIANDGGYILTGHQRRSGTLYAYVIKVYPEDAIPLPDIELSDTHIDFGEVYRGEVSECQLTIFNCGDFTLVISDIRCLGNGFSFNYDTTLAQISAGDSLELTVSFTPGDAISYTGSLVIDSNVGVVIATLIGTGLPRIEVSTQEINFGSVAVGYESNCPLTIYNRSNTPLILNEISTSSELFTPNFELADSVTNPGDSLGIAVTFAPTVVGLQNELLVIDNDDELVEIVLTSSSHLGKLSYPPDQYSLYQNYPNPFNQATVLIFDLPLYVRVIVKTYNIFGQEVAVIVDDNYSAGRYSVRWNSGELPSGVYFVQMEAADYRQVRKVVLLK